MFSKLIDRIINTAGEWNSQLFRELKGRLQLRNIVFSSISSLGMQIALLTMFLSRLPTNPRPGNNSESQTYCILAPAPLPNSSDRQLCQLDRLGQVITDWPKWWGDMLTAISWTTAVILIVGGLYFLANDLRREEKRGTLDFVRLSPQSAAAILTGKLIGVPILIYLAISLAMPFQLIAGMHSKFGLLNTLLWDGLWAVIVGLFYLGGMLLILIVPVIPIALAALAWWLQSLTTSVMQSLIESDSNHSFARGTYGDLTWFYLPVTDSVAHTMIFGIFSCSLVAYCLWLMLGRRYVNPLNPLISKKQSYQFGACFQVWLIGMVLPALISGSKISPGLLVIAIFFQVVFALIIASTILPHRDVLREWCRDTDLRFKSSQRWVKDLLWDDRSPAVLAFGTHLGLAGIFWVPIGLLSPVWLSSRSSWLPSFKMGLVAICILLLLLCYGILGQLSATKKWPKYLNGFIVMLPLVSPVMVISVASLLLLEVPEPSEVYLYLIIIIAIECLVAGGFLWLLWRKMQQMGRSETQKILRTI
jgi:hypothetical protein